MRLAPFVLLAGFLLFLVTATCSVIEDASATDNNELNACLMEVTELKAELDEEMRYNLENERIMRELVRDCEAELKCKVTFK